MFIFLSMETLVTFFANLGFDISTLSVFESVMIFLVSNMFYLICWFIIIRLAYKLILKLYRFIF